MNALEIIINRYKDKNVIIVTHGGLINSILSEVSHGEIGTGKTVLKNGCISILKNDFDKWTIESFNQSID